MSGLLKFRLGARSRRTGSMSAPSPPAPAAADDAKSRVRSVSTMGCRSVDEFDRLNVIQEGTYGVVYRARDKRTGEIVALKKLKMEREKEGFPITSIREIRILMGTKHPNIVDLREVVVGTSISSIFIVMEFLEHDLKDLTEHMETPFISSEIKCLLQQLLLGVAHLHKHWIVHRDLKTSNLLMSNKGVLKIADFGLARLYGSPQKPYTQMVVTLWYRAPELLLGSDMYTPAIDVWSVGCIFAEWLNKGVALLQGRSEIQMLDAIFRLLGAPNERSWPGFLKLKHAQKLSLTHYPTHNSIRQRLSMTEACFDLLNSMLAYDPEKRITAEAALKHQYFSEAPRPQSLEYMPTFPSAHEGVKRRRPADELAEELKIDEETRYEQRSKAAAGFQLKF